MTSDVKQALDTWRKINSLPRSWATFESVQFSENHRVTRVQYGSIHSDGTKECAIGTKLFSVHGERVEVTELVHS